MVNIQYFLLNTGSETTSQIKESEWFLSSLTFHSSKMQIIAKIIRIIQIHPRIIFDQTNVGLV